MSLQSRIASFITRLGTEVKALRTEIAARKAIFPIWAEENGALASNAYEWSWGNGSVGAAIGIVVPINCELFSVTFNAEVAGTSLTMLTQRNGITIATTTHVGQNSVANLGTAVAFNAGDRVSFRTGIEVGTFSDCRVCAWFRET